MILNARDTYYLLARSLVLENPDNLREVKNSMEKCPPDWRMFNAIASNHLVLQCLWPEFQKYELIGFLPGEFASHLESIHSMNIMRNRQILEQVTTVSRLLNQKNIKHLFLKGSALLIKNIYPDPGYRIMEDIDLLVHEDDWLRCAGVLMEEGYQSRNAQDNDRIKERKHFPRLIKPGQIAEIEIHQSALNLKLGPLFPTSLLFEHSEKQKESGLVCLENPYLLIHTILHAMREHKGYYTAHIRLRDMLDGYMIRNISPVKEEIDRYPHFKKEIQAFTTLEKKLFLSGTGNEVKKYPVNFFLMRHEFNLRSRIFLRFWFFLFNIPKKMFNHYVRVPLKSIADQKTRKHLLKNLLSREAWKKHLKSYSGKQSAQSDN